MKFASILAAFMAAASICAPSSYGDLSDYTVGTSIPVPKVVRYLDTYDQLNNFIGQDGLFFVRNAGLTPHGDPTVRSGWAVYTYDVNSKSWKQISREDLISIASLNPNDYLTKRLYQADIGPFKEKVNRWNEIMYTNAIDIAKIKADNIIINGRMDGLDKKIDNLASNTVAGIVQRVDKLDKKVVGLDDSLKSLTGEVDGMKGKISDHNKQLTDHDKRIVIVESKLPNIEAGCKQYTDKVVAENKLDVITNTAARINKAIELAGIYTDNKVTVASNNLTVAYRKDLNERTNEIMDKFKSTIGDIGGMKTVSDYVSAKINTTIDIASKDASKKANEAFEQAVNVAKDNAVAYTDTAVENAKKETSKEIEILKKNTDKKIGELDGKLDNVVVTIEKELVDSTNAVAAAIAAGDLNTLASAKGYTDTNISNLRSIKKSGGNEAWVFNENDGGGSKMTMNDGTTSFVGVHDGSGEGTDFFGQLYVVNGSQKTKLNMYNGKFCYVKGENPTSDDGKNNREIAVKEDLVAAKEDAIAEITPIINKKVDKEIVTTAGKASIFNERDGGGAMFEADNNIKSYVGVHDPNDEAFNGLAGQLYVVNGSNKTKINMYDGTFCYVKGENPTTDAEKAKRELVAVEDLDSKLAAAKEELTSSISKKVDEYKTSDIGSSRILNEADGGGALYTAKDGASSYVGVHDGTGAGMDFFGQLYVDKTSLTKFNMYDGKFCYVKGANPTTDEEKTEKEIVTRKDINDAKAEMQTAIDALAELPRKFKKNGVTYMFDIVDNGDDDITVKITRVAE